MAKVEAKADASRFLTVDNLRVAQARYCSNCGAEIDKCQCTDQSITISIGLSKEMIRAVTGLTALMPRIQISTNRCGKCGHQEHSGACKTESCTCK